MLNPLNIKSISYDFKQGVMEISLKQREVFKGYNRDKVIMKCDYEKYCEHVKKWTDLRINLSNSD